MELQFGALGHDVNSSLSGDTLLYTLKGSIFYCYLYVYKLIIVTFKLLFIQQLA